MIDIEKHRLAHNITDRRTALGPQPPARDVFAHHDWQQAHPVFGLTCLLDYEPFEVPFGLAETFPVPSDAGSVASAALQVAALLNESSALAADRLGYDLSTPWEATSRRRLAAAVERLRDDDMTLVVEEVKAARRERRRARGSDGTAPTSTGG